MDSLSDLRTKLRNRLNDNSSGNYTDAQLLYCLNIAYTETQLRSRCHKRSITVALVQGTHTYLCTQVFEPIELSIGSNILDRKQLGDMGVSLQTWNTTAQATPTQWMQITGSYVRVYPTPSGALTLNVHGFGVADDLALDADEPTAIPEGYATPVLLDRAEAEARKMRPTHATNMTLYASLMNDWRSWCEQIRASIKS